MTSKAFADAIEAQIPALRRYAYALTRDAEAGDDLVQDALERALSRWRLRAPDDLRAWLFAILRNRFIDGYRTARRRGRDAPLELAAGASVPPLGDAMLGTRDILAALDHLPEEQRSLLLLVGVEDMTYAQAADVLGLPIGTVMSRLSRARDRLRGLLDSERTTPHLRRVK